MTGRHKLRFFCSVFLFVLVSIIFTSQLTLRNFPNSADEYSYLISAKLFAAGKLSVPSHIHKEFFNFIHIINDGDFYGKYTPGWPFFLMLGEKVNFPIISNLLFALFTIILIYFLAKDLFSENVARITLFLMATNSYFIFNSSSYFSHSSVLFFLLLFVFLYLRLNGSSSVRLWFMLGIILGIAFIIRPLDAVVFGV